MGRGVRTGAALPPAMERLRERLRASPSFREFPKEGIERSICSAFLESVQREPDAPAVETPERRLTYRDLSRAAGGVAAALTEARGDQQEPVALLMDKSPATVVAIVGCLGANKIYVPLDPGSPGQRVDYILEDSEARVILTDSANLALAREHADRGDAVINVDEVPPNPSGLDPSASVTADSLAYILYTSGSTGRPKGVCQVHRNVIHHARNFINMMGIGPGCRLSVLPSFSFAQSASDLFPALVAGACALPFDLKKEGLTRLIAWLSEQRITDFHTVPTVFRHLVAAIEGREPFPHVRLVRLGGEATTRADVAAFKAHFSPDCVMVVSLGTTEINAVRYFLVGRETTLSGHMVPVGYGHDGTDVLVLDVDGRPVPPGRTGEIAIQSRYITPGYWRRPELTRATFLPAPGDDGARLYLTGDLGSMAEDGCLTYLGRKDFRAKIRGHRVEVSEVEAALMEVDTLREAAVMARKDDDGRDYLAAYVVPRAGAARSFLALRQHLSAWLPDYMIPAACVFMDALPTTPNGKVDRLSLPEPKRSRPLPADTYAAPHMALERELVMLWEDLLGMSGLGTRDDFFELGGDSLAGASFLARVEGLLGRRLSPDLLYRFPTVQQLVRELSQDRTGRAASPLVAVQPHGTRRPVVFVAHVHAWMYRELSDRLGPDQPFYALRPAAPLGELGRAPSLRRLAAEYVEALKAALPQGPYVLGGMSATGVVAFEMAQQLFRAGDEVALLALLDTAGQYSRWSGSPRWRLLRLNAEAVYFLRKQPGEQLRAAGRFLRRLLTREPKRRSGGGRQPHPSPRLDALVRATNRQYALAARGSVMGMYPGRIAYFMARKALRRGFLRDSRLDWRRLAEGGFDLYTVRGNHFEMLGEPGVDDVARELKSALDAVQ